MEITNVTFIGDVKVWAPFFMLLFESVNRRGP